jgi:hypothetical protein
VHDKLGMRRTLGGDERIGEGVDGGQVPGHVGAEVIAGSGDAAITGVPAFGLPKITSVVSRRESPTWRASAL